jgi:hypothetical protein
MLDYAREAAEMARGKTKADLLRDRMLNLALVRLLEMVGEAAQDSTRGEGEVRRRSVGGDCRLAQPARPRLRHD